MNLKVGIVMGSDSDLEVMKDAAEVLENFGVAYEMRIISAHRTPDVAADYAKNARKNGVNVIIAGAGGAAHLARNSCWNYYSACNWCSDEDCDFRWC